MLHFQPYRPGPQSSCATIASDEDEDEVQPFYVTSQIELSADANIFLSL